MNYFNNFAFGSQRDDESYSEEYEDGSGDSTPVAHVFAGYDAQHMVRRASLSSESSISSGSGSGSEASGFSPPSSIGSGSPPQNLGTRRNISEVFLRSTSAAMEEIGEEGPVGGDETVDTNPIDVTGESEDGESSSRFKRAWAAIMPNLPPLHTSGPMFDQLMDEMFPKPLAEDTLGTDNSQPVNQLGAGKASLSKSRRARMPVIPVDESVEDFDGIDDPSAGPLLHPRRKQEKGKKRGKGIWSDSNQQPESPRPSGSQQGPRKQASEANESTKPAEESLGTPRPGRHQDDPLPQEHHSEQRDEGSLFGGDDVPELMSMSGILGATEQIRSLWGEVASTMEPENEPNIEQEEGKDESAVPVFQGHEAVAGAVTDSPAPGNKNSIPESNQAPALSSSHRAVFPYTPTDGRRSKTVDEIEDEREITPPTASAVGRGTRRQANEQGSLVRTLWGRSQRTPPTREEIAPFQDRYHPCQRVSPVEEEGSSISSDASLSSSIMSVTNDALRQGDDEMTVQPMDGLRLREADISLEEPQRHNERRQATPSETRTWAGDQQLEGLIDTGSEVDEDCGVASVIDIPNSSDYESQHTGDVTEIDHDELEGCNEAEPYHGPAADSEPNVGDDDLQASRHPEVDDEPDLYGEPETSNMLVVYNQPELKDEPEVDSELEDSDAEADDTYRTLAWSTVESATLDAHEAHDERTRVPLRSTGATRGVRGFAKLFRYWTQWWSLVLSIACSVFREQGAAWLDLARLVHSRACMLFCWCVSQYNWLVHGIEHDTIGDRPEQPTQRLSRTSWYVLVMHFTLAFNISILVGLWRERMIWEEANWMTRMYLLDRFQEKNTLWSMFGPDWKLTGSMGELWDCVKMFARTYLRIRGPIEFYRDARSLYETWV